MHTVFIHCGLHKTGTTAIQQVFTLHQNILRTNRVLYPRPDELGGHHNLAWRLTRDSRFDEAGPTWRSVIDEISAFDGDAVLSSEDFESILHRPDQLSRMTQAIRGAGRQVCLVIYIRKTAQYIESLYLELLKHGYGTSFGAYQREILKTGFLKYGAWVFQFDVDRVWATLNSVPGLRFIRRDYESLHGESVTADFLSVLGLSKHLLGQSVRNRVNQRHPTAASLSQFMRNRVRQDSFPEESAAIAKLLPQKSVRWSIGNPERPEFAKADLEATYYLNRVFSSHTVQTIRDLASPAGARNAESKLHQLSRWWQGGAAAEFLGYQYQAVLSRPPSFWLIK